MPTNRRRDWELRLRDTLASRDTAALALLLEDVHAADLAKLFPELEEPERQVVLDALSDEQAAELLDELEPEDRADALDLLSTERTSDILEEMPSDEAADLLAELSTEEVDALLDRMEPELAEDVADLLRYSEDIAGGLMAKEFVRVTPDDTVREVLQLLRRHQDDAEMIYYLYVLDEDDRLLGTVTLRKLIVTDPETPMSEIMAREYYSVAVDTPQDEVAEVVRRHDLLAVPVLDQQGRMQGIVTVDDVGDVVQEEAAEELLEMSGTEEPAAESPRPWQARRALRSGLLALAGGIIAAALVLVFFRALEHWASIALLLPLLLVVGITASSQAALAMDHAYESAVERHQPERIYFREALAGGVLALIGALLAGLLLLAMRSSVHLALAVSLPLLLGLWLASVTGASGVVLLRRWGGQLGLSSHTVIVVLSVLLSVTVYLLIARETLILVPYPHA